MSDSPAGSPREASRTAIAVAMARAAHRPLDPPPYLLDDPIAEQLLGDALVQRIQDNADMHDEPLARGLRAHVLLRSRVAEETLQAAARQGVVQYVVLGAGLDTFAWRQPAWAQSLTIYEVDHPGSQADKQQRLARAKLATPSNLHWAAIDFEHESLAHGLDRHGVRRDAPLVASMLGVSMYLTPEDVRRTLAAIAAYPSGTTLVMTYASTDDPTGASAKLAQGAAMIGEPWRSRYSMDELDAELAAAGFRERIFPTTEDLAPYFANQAVLQPPVRPTIVIATV